MIKVLKWILFALLSLIVFLLFTGFLFLKLSPQFGGKATAAELDLYSETSHFEGGNFINEEAIAMEIDCHSIQKMIKESFQPDPKIAPTQDIKVKKSILKVSLISLILWFE